MSRFITLLLLIVTAAACKEKKQKTVADADLSLSDFIALAPEVKLPYIINDSLLVKKETDSAAINTTVFQTFIPDSVFTASFPQAKTLKLFLLGKSTEAKKGTYVFVKSVTGAKKAIHFFYFKENKTCLGHMKLHSNENTTGNQYCKIDGRYNISFIKEQKTPTGEYWTDERLYYMDGNGKMILTMTNSTQDKSDEIMGNPIDTLPRKNKFSADYSNDKKNLVSVRDGNTPEKFQFFIHFSKQNGDCVGEIKGEGEFTTPGKGVFHDDESPCEIIFSFSSGSVTIKESNGCGSYRGITCFFEGTYTKKKEPVKPKATVKKK
ncbi:MAG: hypothetical protein K2X48_17030 [Chitinophagaceae bacterium]|nr:hypothetical protein [Chitinophagaceae bacterium]